MYRFNVGLDYFNQYFNQNLANAYRHFNLNQSLPIFKKYLQIVN